MALDHFRNLISELGKIVGLKELAPDETGHVCLGFDDDIVLHMEIDPSTEDLVLFSELGTLAEDNVAEACRKLMQANLFWQDTGGGTLGLEPESRTAVLAMRKPVNAFDFHAFQAFLENFVNTAEKLQAGMATLAEAAEPQRPVGEPGMMPGIRA